MKWIQRKTHKIISSLDNDFKKYSNENLDSDPVISYYIIPHFLNEKKNIDNLKSVIEESRNYQPILGRPNNSYKNTAIPGLIQNAHIRPI